ncbi:MAG: hypothetical protein EBX35_05185 [Planctomycetia bacterium]|nr:hypothetical protein [Planctomycetia bacterium]
MPVEPSVRPPVKVFDEPVRATVPAERLTLAVPVIACGKSSVPPPPPRLKTPAVPGVKVPV